MRSIFIAILLAGSFLLSNFKLSAQASKNTTINFKVQGECGQCKQRIETAAKDKGVIAALWNAETKLLTLTYNPSKTTVEKVQERIAAVGHDTELKMADDEVYSALPECCLYRKAN